MFCFFNAGCAETAEMRFLESILCHQYKESTDILQRSTDMSTIGCNRIQVLGGFDLFLFTPIAGENLSNSTRAFLSLPGWQKEAPTPCFIHLILTIGMCVMAVPSFIVIKKSIISEISHTLGPGSSEKNGVVTPRIGVITYTPSYAFIFGHL